MDEHARTPVDHRRIEEAAADWIARRSDPGRAWTDADEHALQQWLQASPAHQVAWLRLDAVWRGADRLAAPTAAAPGASEQADAGPLPRIAAHSAPLPELGGYRFRPRARRRRRGWSIAVAATIACIALGTVALFAWRQAPEPLRLVTALGRTSEAALVDGSRVVLSSDTELAVLYGRRERRIELKQGEALFDVAKDPRRPFVVRAGDGRVIAVGTRFSVRRSPRGTRVVVDEGRVRMDPSSSLGAGQAVFLGAGDTALLADGKLHLERHSQAEIDALLAWRNGEVVLRRTPLRDAVEEFNRFNMRPIVVADPALDSLRVDGGFRADNAEGFVRLLELGFGIAAEQRPDRIELRRR